MRRIARIDLGTGSLWLGLAIGVAGFGWGAATNPAALAPLWSGESWTWLAVLLAAALLVAVMQRLARRRANFALIVGSLVVALAFGVQAFATVALILVSAYALGSRLLEWAEAKPSSTPPDYFGSTVVGLAACALVLGVTAHWHTNVAIGYLALSLCAIILGARPLRDAWSAWAARSARDDRAHASFPVLAALWFAFFLHVVFAALPERYYDALAMHLVIARALELFGRWQFNAGQYAWAVQPMGANWLFGWAYVLAGEYAAKLLNAAFLLLVCGLIVHARMVSRASALLAAALLTLMPLAFVVSASLFVDNALTMFTLAAVLFAVHLREHTSPRAVAGFALAAGAAVAVKLHGVLAAAAMALVLLAGGGWRAFFRSNARALALALAAVLGALGPYAYAWHATGNPVFPHFNGIFKSPLLPPTNFDMPLYPGGLSLTDFVDLTFQSHKYLEGRDGAAGFALPLLFPAGLLVTVFAGSAKIRLAALAALAYSVLVLVNIRYVRYLFPVLPLLALVLVYPLSVARQRSARWALYAAALVGTGWGLVRIPAAGWILGYLDPPTAFGLADKNDFADVVVPQRKLGRLQAALGDNGSKVVMFGPPVGADIRGQPLYTNWYYPKLQALVLDTSRPGMAGPANALAALGTTHLIFDTRVMVPEWKPWHEAAQAYGRLIASTPDVELYEFHADAVPGMDLLSDATVAWQGWQPSPPQEPFPPGETVTLPTAAVVSRPVDVAALSEGSKVRLAVDHVCTGATLIRVQINWLRADGSFISVDAHHSPCGETPGSGTLAVAKPKDARFAYLYLTNDGAATARLSNVKATAMPKL